MCGVLLAVCGLQLGGTADATIIVVRPDGSGDLPSIQAAIDFAQSGDVIRLATGVYTGTGMVDLNVPSKALTIESEDGQPGNCVIDCGGSEGNPHRAFVFGNGGGTGTTVRGISIRNGHQERGGAIHCSAGASPFFENCVFAGNRATLSGGALHCGEEFGDNSAPVFVSCRFQGNRADSLGGAVYCAYSLGRFESCAFLENHAKRGGAIACDLSVPRVSGSLFLRNTATLGGGVCCLNAAAPRFEQCTFHANGASARGAAVWSDAAVPILERVIITGSTSGAGIQSKVGVFQPELRCTDLYGNAGGDWVGNISNQRYLRNNMFADPRYCDLGQDDLTLAKNSPCAPENTPCGGLGAFGVACDESPVKDETWGGLRGRYR